ncbi:MAG TPA: S8 family serine peptidase, partial [Anaerolineales bacterium]|nr:S8 family serine peptidase [Anaerolineales bacterium]
GVAPNAQIMPLRVLNASGVGSYSDVAAAIVYAADHGAQVINLSLGGSNPSSTLENAVNYAISKDVIVVAAAGNNGTEGALYPAAYSDVIAVGSVDPNLERSSFSNYGSQVDIWAPGRDILTTKRDGSYRLVSGTSFAAPYVAGASGLLLSLGKALHLDGSIVNIGGNAINITSTASISPTSPTPILGDTTPVPTNDPILNDLGVIGADGRVQITNTTVFPWSAIVSIERDGSPHCSGAMISSQYVLTAGHCILNRGTWYFSDDLAVIPGRNGSSEPFGRESVVEALMPSEWWDSDGNAPGFDYAILKVNHPFPASVGFFELGYFSNSYLSNGSRIFNIAGYPGDKCGGNECGSTLWLDGRAFSNLDDNNLNYQIDTYGGQSGSAIWTFDGTHRIVGVHNTGCAPEGQTCSSNSTNSGSRVTPDFIQNLRGWNVPFTFVTNCVPLTINIQGSGSVNTFGSNSAGCAYREFVPPTTTTLTAKADTGWTFSHWIGASGGATTSYTIYGPTTITAVFIEDQGGPSDTTPPTGSWTNPSNNATISSSNVTLTVNASDNAGGSGVREVRWSAKWSGSWHGIGTDTSAPYSMSWNMCS